MPRTLRNIATPQRLLTWSRISAPGPLKSNIVTTWPRTWQPLTSPGTKSTNSLRKSISVVYEQSLSHAAFVLIWAWVPHCTRLLVSRCMSYCPCLSNAYPGRRVTYRLGTRLSGTCHPNTRSDHQRISVRWTISPKQLSSHFPSPRRSHRALSVFLACLLTPVDR
jgi:hypothetical protein